MTESLRNIAIDIFKLLSVILILVFFLGRVPYFKQMFFRKPSNKDTFLLAIFLSRMRQPIPGRSQSSWADWSLTGRESPGMKRVTERFPPGKFVMNSPGAC